MYILAGNPLQFVLEVFPISRCESIKCWVHTKSSFQGLLRSFLWKTVGAHLPDLGGAAVLYPWRPFEALEVAAAAAAANWGFEITPPTTNQRQEGTKATTELSSVLVCNLPRQPSAFKLNYGQFHNSIPSLFLLYIQTEKWTTYKRSK